MNKENFKAVLDQISKHPKTWDQSQWHCGAIHCFAGWAQVLAGKTPNAKTVRTDARMFLDLGSADAYYLFQGRRRLSDFKAFLESDCDGFDRDGFDRDGFDRVGFDRDGFDRDGLDKNNKSRPEAA